MATLEPQLIEAGSAWRAAQPAIAMPDFRQRRANLWPAGIALIGALGAIGVVVAIVSLGLPTPLAPGIGPSPSSTAQPSPQPSATPRVIAVGDATWMVACGGTPDFECDGVVRLFTGNLAWSWRSILDASGGRLTLAPRPCPTRADGLTAANCWDVSAIIPNEPFCMVVANGANDPRYPDFFEIGGQDGADRAGGPPAGWPMCLSSPSPEATQGLAFLTPFPPQQVRDAIVAQMGVGVDPLSALEREEIDISSNDAIRTALASRGVGVPGPSDRGAIVWTSTGFVYLASYTEANPGSYGGGDSDRSPFPAYLVQVIAPPIAGYPGFNTALVIIDAQSGDLVETIASCNGPLCNPR